MKRITAFLLAFIFGCCSAAAETAPGDAVPGEFILGADVSELTAQENSGAVYYDRSGVPADALKILAESGINHIRVRVWNDPFDAQGRGYGGGNIQAETAAELSARAAAEGMKTLVDFHYSDFWADPSRQLAPKAWAGMNPDEKAEALAAFTRETLGRILDAGGDVDMVQVGNETNNGMAGEGDPDAMARLIAAGCRAVSETAAERGLQIRTCVHLTDLQDYGRLSFLLETLNRCGAEYDLVALSYYPYWHGTMNDMFCAADAIRKDFGKDVFIAETAWPFTLEDGDGSGNVIGYDPGMYPATPEGQAQALADVYCAAVRAGALGVFYWGGIWTPVGPDAETNRDLWETWGSGWATRFANEYDPEHVGDSYGGSGWDNQALFDFGGRPLPVLDMFRQISEGRIPTAGDSLAAESAGQKNAGPEDGAGNLVANADFEAEDRSMWETASDTGEIPFDYQVKAADAHSGSTAFHYWSPNDMSFSIRQTLTGLEPGIYEASVWSQGGDMKDASLVLYVTADGRVYTENFMNTRWADWQHPVIRDIPVTGNMLTIGVKITCGAKSWGTLDDFSVTRTGP